MVQWSEERNKDFSQNKLLGNMIYQWKRRRTAESGSPWQQSLLDWYHTILMHSGQARMRESVMRYFTCPGWSKDIKEYVANYEICKKRNQQIDKKIPLRDPPGMDPWEVFTVDLCGPWKVEVEYTNERVLEKKNHLGTHHDGWSFGLVDRGCGWTNNGCVGIRVKGRVSMIMGPSSLVENFKSYWAAMSWIKTNDGEEPPGKRNAWESTSDDGRDNEDDSDWSWGKQRMRLEVYCKQSLSRSGQE